MRRPCVPPVRRTARPRARPPKRARSRRHRRSGSWRGWRCRRQGRRSRTRASSSLLQPRRSISVGPHSCMPVVAAWVVPGGGVEPPSKAPKARVLPLDDPGPAPDYAASTGGPTTGSASVEPRRQPSSVLLVPREADHGGAAPGHHRAERTRPRSGAAPCSPDLGVPGGDGRLEVVEQERPERLGVAAVAAASSAIGIRAA